MGIKSEMVTFRLGPKLREELEKAAAEDEMVLGEFVRYVLADYLKHRPVDSTEEPAA